MKFLTSVFASLLFFANFASAQNPKELFDTSSFGDELNRLDPELSRFVGDANEYNRKLLNFKTQTRRWESTPMLRQNSLLNQQWYDEELSRNFAKEKFMEQQKQLQESADLLLKEMREESPLRSLVLKILKGQDSESKFLSRTSLDYLASLLHSAAKKTFIAAIVIGGLTIAADADDNLFVFDENKKLLLGSDSVDEFTRKASKILRDEE